MATEKQIISSLKEEYPAIYEKILIGINDVPESCDFLGRFTEIINSFCFHRGIEITHLTLNLKGQKAQAKLRQELYAVILYLLHPKKLYGIKDTPFPILMTSITALLDEDYKNASYHIRTAIGLFAVDKVFRVETIRIALLVKKDLERTG